MTSQKSHAGRMSGGALLRERSQKLRELFPAPIVDRVLSDWDAYASELAAALEAERSKVASLEKERDEAHAKGRRSGYTATVGALHNAMPTWFREPDPDKVIPRAVESFKAAEEKLRAAESEWEAALCKALDERNVATLRLEAAERVVEAARVVFSESKGAALCSFDTINPDGSTGDPNPSE